jgi:hypothetical protein
MNQISDYNVFTTWEPEPNYAVMLPSRLPDRHGTLVLPESYTKKTNSGICISVGLDIHEDLLNMELFFPTHAEYQVNDSDTGALLYIVQVAQVILKRKPPQNIWRVSREKALDNSAAETFRPLEHSLQ